MELSPAFTALIASNTLLKAPAGTVFDSIESMGKPGNEVAAAAAREYYGDEVRRSDFGATDAGIALSGERVAASRRSMARHLRVGQDQIASALVARDSGAPGAYDAMELRYYTR